MKPITINLSLTENGKPVTLCGLINEAGAWLRGQYPEIMEIQTVYNTHTTRTDPVYEIPYLVYVGHEIKGNLLSLTYNYQKP